MDIPQDLMYTADHEWVSDKGDGFVRVGITDFAQQALGDVIFVDLPKVGDEVKQGDLLGEIESTKSVSEVYAPVSGKVVDVNAALDATCELVNREPYESGWLCVIEVAEASSIAGLLDADAYREITVS